MSDDKRLPIVTIVVQEAYGIPETGIISLRKSLTEIYFTRSGISQFLSILCMKLHISFQSRIFI